MHVLQDGFGFERGAVKAGHHALLKHLIEPKKPVMEAILMV